MYEINRGELNIDVLWEYLTSEKIGILAVILFLVPFIFLIISIKACRKNLDSENLIDDDSLSEGEKVNIITTMFKTPGRTILTGIIISLLTAFSIVAIEDGEIGIFFVACGLALFYTVFFATGLVMIPKSEQLYGFNFSIYFIKLFWIGFTMFHSFFFFYPLIEYCKDIYSGIAYVLSIFDIYGMIFCMDHYLNNKRKNAE